MNENNGSNFCDGQMREADNSQKLNSPKKSSLNSSFISKNVPSE